MKRRLSRCPNMTPYILMIALSTHSFFEGLATGLATDEGSLFNIVIAIDVHKSAAAISLGISLVKTFPNNFTLCRWLIFIFSIASPIGIVVGMILIKNTGIVFQLICNCLAAGSFLYIACSEVIVEEFSAPAGENGRLIKLLWLLLGSSIITCLWFIED